LEDIWTSHETVLMEVLYREAKERYGLEKALLHP
jgi:hypothetical protein